MPPKSEASKRLWPFGPNTRDITEAEDALQSVFVSALEQWPKTGVPQSPQGWLLTTARRQLIDRARRMTTADEKSEAYITRMLEEAAKG